VIIKNVIAGRTLVQSLAVAYSQGRMVSILDPRWQKEKQRSKCLILALVMLVSFHSFMIFLLLLNDCIMSITT